MTARWESIRGEIIRGSFLLLAALVGLALVANKINAQSVHPVPTVNQPLAPSTAVPGTPDLSVFVNGAGFSPASIVNWNGAPLTTAFLNTDKLLAIVPTSNLALPGTFAVTVFTSGPGGGTSNVGLFTVTSPTASLSFIGSTLAVGQSPQGLAVSDFNNDGKPDMVVANTADQDANCAYGGGTISVLLGNGDGTFAASKICVANQTLSVGPGPALVARDFNRDGNIDLVTPVAIDGNGHLTAFLGHGDGTFGNPVLSAYDFGTPLVPSDFNGDGKLDLATGGEVEGPYQGFGILQGNGLGAFGGATLFQEYLVNPEALAVGDFNGDGIVDLAIVGQPDLVIFLGNGNGTFTAAANQPAGLNVSGAITAADFNGDGKLDLITGGALLFGHGDGTFTAAAAAPPCNPAAVADLNGDGKLDLVCTAGNTVLIFLGNGDGTFQPGFSEAVGNGASSIGVADFNGDGRLDLAVVNSADNTVSLLLQTQAQAGVQVTLLTSSDPSFVDQAVAYTVVVSAGPIAPTGSVALKQGKNTLGTATLSNGQASIAVAFPTTGTFPIIASYSGDQNYPAKNSAPVKQLVNKSLPLLNLFSTFNPSVYGHAIILACTVAGSDANHAATGTVTFRSGGVAFGTAALANGYATLTKKNLPAGSLAITATYNGDKFNQTSTSAILNQVVSPAVTAVALSSSINPSTGGQSVEFKATVSSPTAAPVGSVTFSAGATILGTVNLSAGKAGLTTSTLPTGANTVTATYNGTSNISGSSASLTQTVD